MLWKWFRWNSLFDQWLHLILNHCCYISLHYLQNIVYILLWGIGTEKWIQIWKLFTGKVYGEREYKYYKQKSILKNESRVAGVIRCVNASLAIFIAMYWNIFGRIYMQLYSTLRKALNIFCSSLGNIEEHIKSTLVC